MCGDTRIASQFRGARRAVSSRFRTVVGGAVKGGTAFYDDRKRKKLAASARSAGIVASLLQSFAYAPAARCHARKRV
jgi:hypothetical protein